MENISKFNTNPTSTQVLAKINKLVDEHNEVCTSITNIEDSLANINNNGSSSFESINIGGLTLTNSNSHLTVNEHKILTDDSIAPSAERDSQNRVISDTYLALKSSGELTIGIDNPPESLYYNSQKLLTAQDLTESTGVTEEVFNSVTSGLMPRITRLEETPQVLANKLLDIEADGSVSYSVANLGSASRPVYILDGVATPISVNITSGTEPAVSSGVLPAISQGTLQASEASIGASDTPIYLENGVFKACSMNSAGTSLNKDILTTYGIVGDGITDDTIALQSAISDLSVLELPSGNYLVNDTLELNNSITILGNSATIIQTNANKATLELNRNNIILDGINFTANTHPAANFRDTDIAIKLTSGNNISIKNCNFNGYRTAIASNNESAISTLEISNCTLNGYTFGIILDNIVNCNINNCTGLTVELSQYTNEALNSETPTEYTEGNIYDVPYLISVNNCSNIIYKDLISKTNSYSTNFIAYNSNNLKFINCDIEGISILNAINCTNVQVLDNSIRAISQNSLGTTIEDIPVISLKSCISTRVSNNYLDIGNYRALLIDNASIPSITRESTLEGYYVNTDKSLVTPTGVSYESSEVTSSVTVKPYTKTYTCSLFDEDGDLIDTFSTIYTISVNSDEVEMYSDEIIITNNIIKSTRINSSVISGVASTNLLFKDNTFDVDSDFGCIYLRGCALATLEGNLFKENSIPLRCDDYTLGLFDLNNTEISVIHSTGKIFNTINDNTQEISKITLSQINSEDVNNALGYIPLSTADAADTYATISEVDATRLLTSMFMSMRLCQYQGLDTITQESSVIAADLIPLSQTTANTIESATMIDLSPSGEVLATGSTWKLVSAASLNSLGIAYFVKISD